MECYVLVYKGKCILFGRKVFLDGAKERLCQLDVDWSEVEVRPKLDTDTRDGFGILTEQERIYVRG